MSRRLLLLALMIGLVSTPTVFAADGKDGEDVQRKSGARGPVASYPLPFQLAAANPRTDPAISTGYYFVDSDDEAADYWRPDPSQFVDTLTQPSTWRRILSGPNQFPSSYWTSPSQNIFGGWAFFRNPGNLADSTDNAFAGPISIGFPFYFNGVRYDSVYISTNGLIALSNRRYFYEYDEFGFPTQRALTEVQPGVFSAYDQQSDDLRTRSGNGMTDTQADDFGYQYIACNNAPGTATAGIRSTANTMLTEAALAGVWSATIGGQRVRPPLIAAAWDDLQLSVFDSENSVVDDFGRAYFKRSPANDKFVIYWANLTPRGAKTAIVGGVRHDVNFQANNRPGIGEHYRFSMQVTLDRSDSSVKIQYERFFGIAPRNALQPHAATVWVRCNSTVGVSGPARRLNWSGFPAAMPANTYLDYSVPKYTQSTEYLFDVNTHPQGGIRATSKRNDDNTTPKDFLAIKFKQWQNTLRVINVFYRVHPLNANAPLDFSVTIPAANANNYEILAGEDRLGSIQPVAIVQNLTNDIQGLRGVNYMQQGINFKVRFKIQNEATGKIVYNTSKAVNNSALSDPIVSNIQLCDIAGSNVPYTPGHFVKPYEFVRVTFPPFTPNAFIEDQIGRLFTSVIAEPRDSVNTPLGDEWPFDDTTGIRLFAMRRLGDLNDNVNEFHLVGGAAMPSTLKWVNIEADVVDGDELTNNPPPPRGTYFAANSTIYSIKSPVIRMNRVDLGNLDIPQVGRYGGDELRSFPINLSNRKRAVLSFSYQRAGKLTSIARGFSDNRLIGPEHQVNMNATNQLYGGTPRYRKPDLLELQFATPSSDQLNGITNIAQWQFNPAKLATNQWVPAYQVWGGSGYTRGFDQVNHNQQLINAYGPGGGLREDLFDDGKDFEYYKASIPLPDTILRWVNEGARNFRFRFQVSAVNNAQAPLPADDEDNFFIDNIKILYPDEVTDVEFSNITLVWPYTMAPASQVTRVPIRVKLSNTTNIPAPAFSVRLQIKPAGQEARQIYCRTITVPTLAGNREVLLPFPDANFRQTTPGNYKITGRIFFPGNDLDTLNDSTFSTFQILYGPAFAYEENPNNSVNDVPNQAFSGVSGKGLNHRGSSAGSGGGSRYSYPFGGGPTGQYSATFYGYGPTPVGDASYGADAGNASGQMAVRFTLYTQDTVAGYQAFWAELNQDILNISFSLYRDQGGIPGGQAIANSTIIRRRGEDETDQSVEPVFGKYSTYKLSEPVVLAPGEYWVSVAQMGTEGYELGASSSRMGMVTTLYSDIPAFGTGNRTLMIDKNFRVRARSGALLNDNRFAFELTRFSGDWVPFMPTIGNPGYPHLDAVGNSLGYNTHTRGTWIPLLRPYFGDRSYARSPVYVDCITPVELTYFDGKARMTGVDLFWETASEEDNQGFHVDRRVIKESTDLQSGVTQFSCVDQSGSDMPWTTIGFVAGAGNTTESMNYKYFDADVATGGTYQYRLRQVDFDGSESFSNVVNVVVSNGGIVLEDNFPNPTNDKTTIKFRVPNRAEVKLEIFDMMGNLVKTLYNNEVAGSTGDYTIEWNGRNEAGYEVASGSYMYKLTAGESVLSKTMTVVR
jgi:hypothetical protein